MAKHRIRRLQITFNTVEEGENGKRFINRKRKLHSLRTLSLPMMPATEQQRIHERKEISRLIQAEAERWGREIPKHRLHLAGWGIVLK